MTNYSIVIKKGHYQLDISTTDKDFVVEQFELWIKKASEYAKKKKSIDCKNIVASQIKAEEELTKQKIEEQIGKPAVDEKIRLEKQDEKVSKSENQPTQNEQNNNLDIFYTPLAQKAYNETISNIVEETAAKPVFDDILENSMNNPQTELKFKPTPSIKKDEAFLNYIGERKIEKKIDYLLFTAYYFTQYEQKPRFTLKQLNAKLMQNIAVIIDHAVLQEAINRDYIECLPDLTGLVGASEYRLTSYGEKVLLDE